MIDDQENIRRIRGIVKPCKKCSGRRYITKKQTHPREGLIEVREPCVCLNPSLPVPVIEDGELVFKLNEKN